MNKILVNYNNLYRYYEIEKVNLSVLEDRKEEIRNQYFKTTSQPSNSSSKTNKTYENYDVYMIALEKEQILEKIQEKRNLVNRLSYYSKKIEYNLSQLQGIEYQLFYKIINGINVSKAIEEIVEENYLKNKKIKDESIIWKKYYPNIKKEISEFKKIQEEVSKIYE